ncbi:MAG: hypothetical protein ACR2HD_12025 [Solirubrobacteraceae bacterium]
MKRERDGLRRRWSQAALREQAATINAASKHTREHLEKLSSRDPFWPAQLAVAAALVLYVTLPKKLTLGPSWLIPACEGVLLAGLIVASPRKGIYSPARRGVAIALVGLVTLANFISLYLLAHHLLKGAHTTNGHALILAGVVIWTTNVLLFGIWYWELDRGGPVLRNLHPDQPADFSFPQMQDPQLAPEDWMPGFVDFLYVSFTNQSAFSPTDAMPLSQKAKLLMAFQALASIVTLGLVVSRAVNILS